MPKRSSRIRRPLRILAILSVPMALAALVRARDRRRTDGAAILGDEGLELEDLAVRSMDGTDLHVTVAGEGGPTLFCVHGWTCNETVYRFQQRHFSERYRVVTMELRGHGGSAIPGSLDYHPDRLAEDLKAVIDHFDPERFAVAGHSLGGFTAFKFYERFGSEHDGRLKGLVIIDSTGTDLVDGIVFGRLIRRLYPFPLAGALTWLGGHNRISESLRRLLRNSTLAYMVVRWGAFGRRPFGNHVEHVREMVLNTPITSTALAAKACLDYHFEHFLPRVEVPVILMAGTRDKLTNRRANERTLSLLPEGRLVMFEGAGHCAQLEQRDAFNEQMDSFLAGVLP